jgi:hypothetical protein
VACAAQIANALLVPTLSALLPTLKKVSSSVEEHVKGIGMSTEKARLQRINGVRHGAWRPHLYWLYFNQIDGTIQIRKKGFVD